MRKYFLYYLNKRLAVMGICMVLCMVLTLILLSTASYVRTGWDASGNKTIKPGDNPFTYLTAVIMVLSTVIPVMEFNFKMKRRTVDMFYSLPVTKVKLFASKYLLGLVEMFVIFLPQWFITFLWVNGEENMFQMYYFWFYLLAASALGILLYSWFSFFFTMASSLVDGIIFMILSCFIVCLVINLGYAATYKSSTQMAFILNPIYYIPYSPIIEMNTSMYYQMCGSYFPKDEYVLNPLSFAVFAVVASVAAVLFFIMNSNDHAEVSGDMSESWFGYRVMIPVYMVTIFTICGNFSALWVISAIGGYIMYSIYRRTFKIKKTDVYILIASIILGLTNGIIIVNFF